MQVDRKQVEDLNLTVQRLKKYDEFFQDSMRKQANIEYKLQNIEKKFKAEVVTIQN